MTENLISFDYNKPLQTFFKDNREIKEQFKQNVTSCFIEDSYLTLSRSHKKQISFEVYRDNIFKNWYNVVQTQKEKHHLIQNKHEYFAKVFAYTSQQLLFSCTLEIAPTYIEIHDVCVGKEHSGKGYCKKYIQEVVQHIKTKYRTHKKIKIMCVADNTPACKCYTRIFGEPKISHLRDGTSINLFEMSIASSQ